jgi:hypothetical protein
MELARELDEIYPAPWHVIIEQLAINSIRLHREGEPVCAIRPAGICAEEEFLIEPFLYRGKPNLLYGEGGVGKSYLALVMCLVAQLPHLGGKLGLRCDTATPALYLDYESDKQEMTKRLAYLAAFSEEEEPLLYRECTLPLVDDIESIQEIVVENGIGLIIVDSLGVALGGSDLNDAVTATSFFSVLRRLKVTSLILTHLSKESLNNKHTSPFGSVFFYNLARSVWEVRREQGEEGEISLGLFHKKNNQGKLFPPIGYGLIFGENTVDIKKGDIKTVPEFLEHLTLRFRISLLLEEGKMGTNEIAKELNTSRDTVRMMLNRMRKDKKVVKIDDKWGLLSNEEGAYH